MKILVKGNIEVESILFMGGAQVFATGCVVALGMTDEQIKQRKESKIWDIQEDRYTAP